MQKREPQSTGIDAGKFAQILSEIGNKGDLPAGADVIQQIQTAIRREDCNALEVVRIILKDTALSSKVLRVVNSSFYRRMGNPVSTVTGAIVLLGFETIRDLSAGLLLIDHFTRKGGSRHIPDGLRRSLYCGLLSQTLSGQVGHSSPEEAYILGLVANFAHLWLAAYYPDDFEKAVRLQKQEHISIERALGCVIGGAPGDIAAAALGQWNFPSHYLDYFREPPATNKESLVTPSARLSAVVNVSADYIACAGAEGPEGGRRVLRRFKNLFSLEPEVFLEAARAANAEFTEQASLNGLPASPVLDDRFLRDTESSEDDPEKILVSVVADDGSSDESAPPGEPEVPHGNDELCAGGAPACRRHGDHAATRERDADGGSPASAAVTNGFDGRPSATAPKVGTESTATVAPAKRARSSVRSEADPPEPGAGRSAPSEEEVDTQRTALESGPLVPSPLECDAATALGIIADITRSIIDRNTITETLSMVLEGVGRIGSFDVVFLALLNVKGDRVVGRLGYGEGVQEHLRSLSVSVRENGGMITETVRQRTPQSAADTSAAVLVPRTARVPPIPGTSFISYPVIVRGKILGALVAARIEDFPPTQADVAVLRLFCDQACLALEKSVN